MSVSLLGWLWWPLAVLVTVLGGVAALLYWWMTRNYDFWSSRGVSGPPPKFPNGHGIPNPRDFHSVERALYEDFGGKRYCGLFEFRQPALYVGDPELICAITIKDFEHFTDRRDLVLSKCMEEMLVSLSGRRWKALRVAMSPAFSSSKLRAMHQLCLETANNLSDYVRETMAQDGKVELKDAFGRFTMDNIAACGFGVDCNSFGDPNSEFTRYASQFFKPLSGYDMFRLLVLSILPRRIGNLLPDRAEPAGAFFQRVVMRTIAHRAEHGSGRRDYLQLLLEIKSGTGERAISDSLIATQAVMFLVGGYDTTASLLTCAGYALATNAEVQQRAQHEIDQVLARHGGHLTFDALSEMHYMDQVVSETLRLYPPFMRIERQCVREYTLPGTELTIPPGTLIIMPVLSLHRDPEYYPDPLRFDPDRFLPEEREHRRAGVYLPFGSGPRGCLAQRFALFEAKLALVAVLRGSTLTPAAGTPPPPLPLDPGAVVATPREPTFVQVLPRHSG
ncbi:probable cytochrome P450 6a13 [Amphibalanus amphitrite]|uniref:probable cytochrome P450 6a13 n=1 Tax=Amphibalanus amphitrite TaxID=1232801 RepID=UPI001C91729D|nr:probable cytochrome P450 6a13 [Amphibalanus amphitrite]